MQNILIYCILLSVTKEICSDEGWIHFTRPNDKNVIDWNFVNQKLHISLNENVKENVTIANFTCSDSLYYDPIITFTPPLGQSELGLVVERSNKTLIVTKTQDYENLKGNFYVFFLTLEDKTRSSTIYVNILNLDDTSPDITSDQDKCVIKENQPGPTNCSFRVHDVDYETGNFNPITYKLISSQSSDINKIFKLNIFRITSSDTNITLDVLKQLDFESTIKYFFKLEATDSGNNSNSLPITVEVQDVNDQPPVWYKIPLALTIAEEDKAITVNVSAKDGDVGINSPIIYKLKDLGKYEKYFSIPDENVGKIVVKRIDREFIDPSNNNIINITIVAHEVDDLAFETPSQLSIIVTDINDNPPVINPQQMSISIKENQYGTLNFKEKITIDDMDMGENAQYIVELVDNSTTVPKWNEAFQIIPSQGYKNETFSISVKNASLLDYDRTDDWHNIILQIKTFDKNKVHVNYSTVNINLINWNDEIPIFDHELYHKTINETTGKGVDIITVHATDADRHDKVIHRIVGDNYKGLLSIDSETGIIKTTSDNVFDYEKQEIIIIQVEARDTFSKDETKNHKKYMQVTIELENVNDETPQIVLPREKISVEENSKSGVSVVNISATDADGNLADLYFEIDWNQTTASKQGMVDPHFEEYHGTLKIETHTDTNNKGKATGHIITTDKTIDFEKFEILSLFIIVTDRKQVNNNKDTAILTITIDDKNDNSPHFITSTITSSKSVYEKSNSGDYIGTIKAIDKDGPKNNAVYFSLKEVNNTEPGLVMIHKNSGEITVNKAHAINADVRKDGTYVDYLYYEIIASDGENENKTNIEIHVMDTNDKIPTLSKHLRNNIEIPECTKNRYLLQVHGIDYDRDENYHTITYEQNNMLEDEIKNIIVVNNSTGEVSIYDNSTSDCSLSRDHGNPDKRTIYLLLRDNDKGQGKKNVLYVNFTITLTDINNQPPILKPKSIKPISENNKEGHLIDTIVATDGDESGTNNSKIRFTISDVYIAENSSKVTDLELFSIQTKSDTYAEIYCGRNLTGYYGNYIVNILAYDLGVPPLQDIKNYTIEVQPYNFGYVTIIYPKNNENITLNKAQKLNHKLYTQDEEPIRTFTADDHQNNKYDIKFKIIKPNTDENNIFFIKSTGQGQAELQLQKPFDKKIYELTIQASHNGGGNSSDASQITIYVIDPLEQPHFEIKNMELAFMENSTELQNSNKIENAIKPLGVNSIYYFIIHQDGEHFKLDKSTRLLSVDKVLDREKKDAYNLTIVATIHEIAPPATPNDDALLYVHIIVNDANDNPPIFYKTLYEGGLTTSSLPDTSIITDIMAHDPDTLDEGKLICKYLDNTLEVSDDSLKNVLNNGDAFKIEKGVVSNKFRPQEDMKGNFKFKLQVIDTAGHTAETLVKIFMLSNENIVTFTFNNKKDDVNKKILFIQNTFSSVLDYNCIVDHVNRISDNKTEIQAHFMNEDLNIITRDTIIKETTDYNILTILKTKFLEKNLDFSDIPSPVVPTNIEKLLKIILITVSVVLGIFCIILVITLILKTRSLKRQLSAMKTNHFGSNSSNLNRIGTKVPNTNRHAVEANPGWNEELNPDNISLGSNNSDLIGIEDKPEFQKSSNKKLTFIK